VSQEILCNDFCMCVGSKEFSVSIARRLKKAVERTEWEIKALLLKQGVSEDAAKEQFRVSLMQSRTVKGLKGIVFEINLDGKEPISHSNLDICLKMFQSIVITVRKMKIAEVVSGSCITFVFPLTKYNFVGGVPLPWRMVLPPQVTEKVGEPLLSAMTLEFKKSPLGVDEVRMEAGERHLYVEIRTVYGRMKTDELSFIQSFDRAKQVAMLFVEERK